MLDEIIGQKALVIVMTWRWAFNEWGENLGSKGLLHRNSVVIGTILGTGEEQGATVPWITSRLPHPHKFWMYGLCNETLGYIVIDSTIDRITTLGAK